MSEQKSVLVIGYGSIGQRHAERLEAMNCRVHICSRRPIDHVRAFTDIAVALSAAQPEYVVIASRTSEHEADLNTLAKQDFTGSVLVEKPLFDHQNVVPKNNFKQLHVAYNLRFHPLIERLKTVLQGQEICSYQVYVGQYLPDWRPDRDYRESYSAHENQGGGVLRDLSHDIDYTIWLLGGWKSLTARGGRKSGLEITSDDCFMLMLDTPHCDMVSLQLNYLDRQSRREILVNTSDHTFKVDLVNGTFSQDQNTETISAERNYTYDAMHQELLGDVSTICATAVDGIDVLNLISSARDAAKSNSWVNKC